MSEWEPATDAERAMRDALRTDDQESYFRILAGVDLLLPVSADALAGLAPLGWGTWSTGGRTHVLAFTSPSALQACLADYTGSARRVAYAELADTWPNLEWWLAVNPGLPIEGYLPAWFVAQLSRGDVRLPKRGPGHEGQELKAAAMAALGGGQPGGPIPGGPMSGAPMPGGPVPGGPMSGGPMSAGSMSPGPMQAGPMQAGPMPSGAAAGSAGFRPGAGFPLGQEQPPARPSGAAAAMGSRAAAAAAAAATPGQPGAGLGGPHAAVVGQQGYAQGGPQTPGSPSASGWNPAGMPTPGPANAPANAPTSAPANAPASGPANAPVSGPASSPVSAPVSAPASGPMSAPVSGPASSPVSGPANAPAPGPASAQASGLIARVPGSASAPGPGNGPRSIPASAPTSAPASAPTSAPAGAPTSGRPAPVISGPPPATPNIPTYIPGNTPASPPTGRPTPGGPAPSGSPAGGSPADSEDAGQIGPGGLPIRTPGAVLPSGLPSRVPAAGQPGSSDASESPSGSGVPAPYRAPNVPSNLAAAAGSVAAARNAQPPGPAPTPPQQGSLPTRTPMAQTPPVPGHMGGTTSDAGLPNRQPAERHDDFVPANETESDLLAAVEAGSTDSFLSTMLLATVLIPVADNSRPGASPGESGFVFRTEETDGTTYVVVFTSRDRLSEHYREPARTVAAKFLDLIRNWPDPAWAFAVNPASPVGARYPGQQVIALASWATEAGLGLEPDEPRREEKLAQPAGSIAQQATMMQKCVPLEQIDYYLERGYDRVAGFVHRANEVEHLRTPGELFAALGLVHDGSPYTSDAKEAYVLRWPAFRPSLYRIPYGGQSEQALRAMDGWVIERPPFRGNGFAPGEGRDVIAEFKVDSVRLPHGTQLWRLDADGNEKIMAIFDADAPNWRRVGEQ